MPPPSEVVYNVDNVTFRTGIAAAVIVLGGIVFAGVGNLVVYVRQHVREEPALATNATHELDALRARFEGRPLIDIRHGQAARVDAPAGGRSDARAIRAVIYDAATNRIVRDDFPIAILRVLKSGGFTYLGELTPFRDDTDFETDRVDVSLDAIRRHRGLLVDHTHASGSRILMWVE